MTLLVVLTILFAMAHAVPGHGGIKASLKASMGRAYGAVYGLISLILLVAMIWAYRQADYGWVYDMPGWGWWANWGFTLAAFFCFGIFLFRGSWRNKLRYPMALAVCLWTTGHLLANGDGKSLVLFGGLALAAVLQALLMARTQGFTPTPERQGHNLLSMLFGLALYGIMTQLHYAVTGMELVQLR